MEADKNPLPEIKIIQTPAWLCRVGRFFCHLQHEGLSSHFPEQPFDDMYERECPDVAIPDLMSGLNQMVESEADGIIEQY